MRIALSTLLVSLAVLAGCSGDGDKKEKKPASGGAPVSSGSKAAAPVAEAPKETTHELPLNPYAKAAVGDVYCAVVKARYEGKTPDGAAPPQSVGVWTGADGTDAEKAIISFETKPAVPENAGSSTWSKTEAPKGEGFFHLAAGEEITDWKVEDEKKTVGDKEFDCKKISATIKSDTPVQITIWLSPDVPVTGMVAMSRRTELAPGCVELIDIEVGGFKTVEPQAQWGKTADELAAALAGAGDGK